MFHYLFYPVVFIVVIMTFKFIIYAAFTDAIGSMLLNIAQTSIFNAYHICSNGCVAYWPILDWEFWGFLNHLTFWFQIHLFIGQFVIQVHGVSLSFNLVSMLLALFIIEIIFIDDLPYTSVTKIASEWSCRCWHFKDPVVTHTYCCTYTFKF